MKIFMLTIERQRNYQGKRLNSDGDCKRYSNLMKVQAAQLRVNP